MLVIFAAVQFHNEASKLLQIEKLKFAMRVCKPKLKSNEAIMFCVYFVCDCKQMGKIPMSEHILTSMTSIGNGNFLFSSINLGPFSLLSQLLISHLSWKREFIIRTCLFLMKYGC
jgi:hypothetical protein